MKTVTVPAGRVLRVSIGGVEIGVLSVPGTYRLADAALVTSSLGPVDANGTIDCFLKANEADLIRVEEDALPALHAWWAAGCPTPVPDEFKPAPGSIPAIVTAKFSIRQAMRAARAMPDGPAKVAAVQAALAATG